MFHKCNTTQYQASCTSHTKEENKQTQFSFHSLPIELFGRIFFHPLSVSEEKWQTLAKLHQNKYLPTQLTHNAFINVQKYFCREFFWTLWNTHFHQKLIKYDVCTPWHQIWGVYWGNLRKLMATIWDPTLTCDPIFCFNFTFTFYLFFNSLLNFTFTSPKSDLQCSHVNLYFHLHFHFYFLFSFTFYFLLITFQFHFFISFKMSLLFTFLRSDSIRFSFISNLTLTFYFLFQFTCYFLFSSTSTLFFNFTLNFL